MNDPQQLTTLQTHWPAITVAVAWFIREWHQSGITFASLQAYCDGRTNGLIPWLFRLIIGSPKQPISGTTPGAVNQEMKN